MRKSAEAFRTISEVSELLETPAHVLRFWESKFPQVKPVKRAGGRRYYRPADIALLGGIKKLLHGDGMTIRGVQKLLGKHGARHVAEMSPYPLPAETAPPPSARRTASRGGGKTAGKGGAGHRAPAPEGRADPGRLIETAVDGIRNRRPKAAGDAAGDAARDAAAGAAAEAARAAAAPPSGAEGARP
ncbi:MerR family transcriptional regulator, partial [Albidovulum sp.]